MAKEKDAISQMSHVTVKQAVETIKNLDMRTPAMLHGEPGCGKTRTIQSIFEDEGFKVINVLAGQSEPTDIQGIPFNYKDFYARYLMPWWGFYASNHPEVKKQKQDGKMLLFFDDLPTAHEQTQAAFFKLIDEKHLGEYNIRENVRIVAAGNRSEDLSATNEMPFALRNRFLHLYVQPDFKAWEEWAVRAGKVHPHVLFYLRMHQEHLSTFEDAKNSSAHAWATPRTWEMLSRALTSMEESGLREYQINATKGKPKILHDHEFIVVQGCIGTLAIQFLTVIKGEYNAVSPEDIVKNPEKCDVPGPTEIDRLFATVTNLEFWIRKEENHKHYKPFLIYLNRLPAEFGLLLARQFSEVLTEDMDMNLRLTVLEDKHFVKFLDTWEDRLTISFDMS